MEPPRLQMTSYLDVISSWCFWASRAWQELQERYRDRVDFRWKIALMDETGLPPTHEAMEWYYRRSGMLMRSPVKLRVDWHEPGRKEYPEPNCIAEAAREFGAEDDRVWLALARAQLLHGKKISQWEVAAEIAARAAGLDQEKLLERAKSSEIEARIRLTTREFHDLKVTQRPTFVIDTPIGDRAIFSGFAKVEPLAATLDAMIDDLVGYEAHAAHFGAPPA